MFWKHEYLTLKEVEIPKLIGKFLKDWDDLRDFVLDAPILSNDVIVLREYIDAIREDIKTKREEWEKRNAD